MTEIWFYHLQRQSLEEALPALLEKVLVAGARAVVMLGSEERVEAVNLRLWTYDDRGFLPHGSARDGFPAEQPIWLTVQDENPNGAKILVLADGACSAKVGGVSVRGTHSLANGVATCVFKLPATAKGKTLSGKISVTVQGATLAKTFSAKVH